MKWLGRVQTTFQSLLRKVLSIGNCVIEHTVMQMLLRKAGWISIPLPSHHPCLEELKVICVPPLLTLRRYRVSLPMLKLYPQIDYVEISAVSLSRAREARCRRVGVEEWSSGGVM